MASNLHFRFIQAVMQVQAAVFVCNQPASDGFEPVAMTSHLDAMASNLRAMAANLLFPIVFKNFFHLSSRVA